jgi:hypothetical protein
VIDRCSIEEWMLIMEYAGVPIMEKRLKTALVREEESDSANTRRVPHVVIVGAGFGGLQAAKSLHHAPVQVTVIDRSNHHLFQPLLYQVATADLSPADISAPIRSILRKQHHTSVILAEVTGVDVQEQRVLMHDRSVPYDETSPRPTSHIPFLSIGLKTSKTLSGQPKPGKMRISSDLCDSFHAPAANVTDQWPAAHDTSTT